MPTSPLAPARVDAREEDNATEPGENSRGSDRDAHEPGGSRDRREADDEQHESAATSQPRSSTTVPIPRRASIRGSQYTSLAYTDRLDELGAAPSVGSRGDAYDNAMAEAWVATFKSELVDGRRFPSYEHAEHETMHWIGFYNEERLDHRFGVAELGEANVRLQRKFLS